MTSILGKDAPLEQSISMMRAQLLHLGFDIEETRWLNPIPNVWSVHIRDKNCPMLFTNGKGASRDAALASALGEYMERLSCNYFFADYYLGNELSDAEFVHYPNERWFPVTGSRLPAELLDEPTLCHYDMKDQLLSQHLVDTNSGRSDRGICALPFVRQHTGERVWFPVNILGNLYVSNGMAAGNTPAEAKVQALSEIFERHIKNTIISSGISLPTIPERVLQRYPSIVAGIEALRSQGFGVIVKDASLGGKFPLVNVTLLNPENGGCFASFGAHPKFQVALERTLTELLQGRALDQLNGFPDPSFDLQEVADQHNIETHFIDSSGLVAWDMFSEESDYEFTEWNIEGDTQAEFERLCFLIHKVDMDIYITEYEHLGVYACRIVVPGMSEIYPVDELVLNNNAAAIELRPLCLRLPELSKGEARSLLHMLDEADFEESRLVAELVGIAADEGTHFAELRVGELRCLLSLRLAELEEALDWCGWVLQFSHLSDERTRLYRALYHCLMFRLDSERDIEKFRPAAELLFGRERLELALAMLSGKYLFDQLPVDDGSLKSFIRHQSLLDAYRRLQKMK